MAFLPGEIDDRPTFPPVVPHFFKIILNDTSRDKKIKIPTKFVTKYRDNMSNPVFFKVPSGLEWKIELRKMDGEVWFENGWQDFSSFYSLDYGHLLVFGYEGNSKFRVRILERSCIEIDYPLQNTVEKTDENEKSSDDSHDTSYHESGDDSNVGSVEIGENHTPCPRKTREKSLLSRPRPCKKNRPSSRGKAKTNIELVQCGSTSIRLIRNSQQYEMMFEKTTKSRDPHLSSESKANVPAASAKATALERASGFKSDRHPPLKVAMTRTYLYRCYLSLPTQFIKKHLNRTVGYVILRVSGGTTWRVKFQQYDTGRCRLLRGWKKFVQENSLAIGDECVFTVINTTKPLFDVVIFRQRIECCDLQRE